MNGRVRGSFYEQANSFRQTAESIVSMSDSEFLFMMTSVMNGIDAFTLNYKMNVFPQLLAQFEEEERKHGYQ